MTKDNLEINEMIEELEKRLELERKSIEFSKKTIEHDESSLRIENKTLLAKLKKYRCLVSVCISSELRDSYLKIIKSFLDKEVTPKEFCDQFSDLRSQDMKRSRLLIEEIETGNYEKLLSNFEVTSMALQLHLLSDYIFYAIDDYDGPPECAEELENTLRLSVKESLDEYYNKTNSSAKD